MVRVVATVAVLGFLILVFSGRIWPGPKYPLLMLFITLMYSISIFGYVVARIRTGQTAEAEGAGRIARGYPLVEWSAVVICIIVQFWWGWYVVLGVLGHDLYRVLRKPVTLKGKVGALLRSSWVFQVLLIVYVLLNKSFFSR